MSQSLANIVVHLVFSTKNRRPLLRDEERGQLHAYITGILKNHDSPLIEINSVRDHIHILFAQSKNHVPAKIVEQVKSALGASPPGFHLKGFQPDRWVPAFPLFSLS
jgi:REP element-mobilizing transposase RayT